MAQPVRSLKEEASRRVVPRREYIAIRQAMASVECTLVNELGFRQEHRLELGAVTKRFMRDTTDFWKRDRGQAGALIKSINHY